MPPGLSTGQRGGEGSGSKRLVCSGQRVHLRIAAVGSCTRHASASRGPSRSELRAPQAVGRGGRGGGGRAHKGEEEAILRAVEEELLPARVMPLGLLPPFQSHGIVGWCGEKQDKANFARNFYLKRFGI